MATKAWGPIYSQPVQESSKKALLPDEIRRKHFARLRNYTYLDYAGAALYSEIQMQEVAKLLSESLLVNPHSKRTETSSTSGEDPTSVDQLKERILELFFNTNSRAYSVIFTSGIFSFNDSMPLLFSIFFFLKGRLRPCSWLG